METTLPAESPWPRRLVWFGLMWAALSLVLAVRDEPTPVNWTLLFAISLSGVYTLLLYRTRSWWLSRLTGRPLRNAMGLGIVNAAVIETLFLVIERLMGTEGVAAHPNLILDLLITMPWYIGMVIIFVRVQHRRRFSPATVLLLGGVYELGADGLVGGTFDGAVLNPAFWILLPLIAFWWFIPVYSSMVLPPAWLIGTTPPPPPPDSPAWRDALRPLRWLIPFVIYLGILLIVLGVLNEIA